MNLSVNNSDNSTSILSIREIVGIVVAFSFMLYLVFPKKNIDDILKHKGENTHLSINYLESMLLYYPDNIQLKLILLENYNKANKLEKAFKLIKDIKKSTQDRDILSRVYEIEYQLLKERYFDTNDSKLLKNLKQRIYDYYQFKSKNRDYLYFLGEAEQLDFKELKYLSLKGLEEENPEIINFQLKQELYYLALNLGYKSEALKYLIELIEYKEADTSLKSSVLYSLLKERDYNRAFKVAKRLFLETKKDKEAQKYFDILLYIATVDKKDDRKRLIELINLYIENRKINQSSIEYLIEAILKTGDIKSASYLVKTLFNKYKDIYNQKNIELTIKTLIYNKELKKALEVALYAENKFNNPKWLDKAIKFATWQGDMKKTLELNIKGFKKYKLKKYSLYISKQSIIKDYNSTNRLNLKKLSSGDFSKIDSVSKYFIYSANIDIAERYFTNLYKKFPRGDILKKLIEFNYKNLKYREGLKNFNIYKSKFKFDKELYKKSANKLIALKKFKKAYNLLKEIEQNGQSNKDTYKKLLDLAKIFKDYRYYYKLLWKMDKQGELDIQGYNQLALLDKKINGGHNVEHIYQRSYKKYRDYFHLMALLNHYIDKNRLDKFKSLIEQLTKEEKRRVENSLDYNLLLTNYYMLKKDIDSGLKTLKKLLKKYKYNTRVYQTYLWFILNENIKEEQKKALRVLIKNPRFRKKVGFPAIILALQFQKSDLALNWIRPILKNSNRVEYKVVYSDILQLQNREDGAEKIRYQIFKTLNQMLKRNPKLKKDKIFISIYLRFINMYIKPYERKNFYFKKYKSIFTKKEFARILTGAYSYSKSYLIVKRIRDKYKLNEPWLEMYLAMSQNDNELKREVLKEDKEIVPFRDRAIASRDIGDIKEAQSLAFKGLEDNSKDLDIYKIYKDMVEEQFPRGTFETKYLKLSSKLFMIEDRVSYRWHLYKNLDISTYINQYRYIPTDSKNIIDTKLAILLKSRYKDFIWSFEIAKHFAKRDFISAILEFKYRFKSINIDINLQKDAKTKQNNQLRMIGIQNSIKIEAKNRVNNRAVVGAYYQKSNYKNQLNSQNMGSAEHLKIYGSYKIRASYPDIKLETYLLISRFKDINLEKISKKLTEIGSSILIGSSRQYKINRAFRPFGIFSLSYNSNHTLGTNMILGFSKELIHKDILNFSINYSRSIDIFDQSYYGLNISYFY